MIIGLDFTSIISCLQSLNPLWVSVLLYVFSIASLFAFWKGFGKTGLYIYAALAVVVSNIQVLKGVTFPYFNEPVALGSVLFMSLFLCSDILNEFYGKKAALKSVNIGFMSYLFVTCIMMLTIGYKPLSNEHGLLGEAHNHIEALFMPAPAILISSLIAYYVSQYIDVFLFRKIYEKTERRHLWLRTLASTTTALLVDNTLFSLLAWYVFAPTPYDMETILWTYIVGTSILRIILTLGYLPMMYLAQFFKARYIK